MADTFTSISTTTQLALNPPQGKKVALKKTNAAAAKQRKQTKAEKDEKCSNVKNNITNNTTTSKATKVNETDVNTTIVGGDTKRKVCKRNETKEDDTKINGTRVNDTNDTKDNIGDMSTTVKSTTGPRVTQRRHTVKEIELIIENAEIGKQLVASLSKQICTLEEEVERLRDICRENTTCNVVIYSSEDDISLAAVTNGSDEGIQVFSRVSDLFQRNIVPLHKRGIGFATFQDVLINRMHTTPFS